MIARSEISRASIAGALAAVGVARGDRVGLFLPIVDLVAAVEAVLELGAIAVPLASRLGVDPIAYHLRDSAASFLIARTAHAPLAREAMTRARACRRLLLLEDLEPPDGPVARPELDDDHPAVFSYAPETRGGRPRGLLHDRRAMRAAVDGVAHALVLREDDEVAIEIPLWEGALELALAARSKGARIVERATDDTSVVALRARDTTNRLSTLASTRVRLRAAIAVGSGPFGVGSARELASRHRGVEVAAAHIVRELPTWLSLDVVARGETASARLLAGPLAGVVTRAEPGAPITLRGDAIPRAYHDAPDETRARFVDGSLVSEDVLEAASSSSVATSRAGDRAALDVLDAHVQPPVATLSQLTRVRERTIDYPIGRGRGASIALDAGIKPMLRELIAKTELDVARARFEAAGWAVEVSPLVFGPTHDGWLGRPESRDGAPRRPEHDRQPLYVGRDRDLLRRAIECERVQTLEGARELGALLGYPSCCVEAFVAHTDDRRAVRLWASAAARTRPGELAARLNMLDPNTFTYVSWFPCRFDCRPSLALADALADRIAIEHPNFVRAIDEALGAPRLVLAPEIQLRIETDASARPRVTSTRVHGDPRAALDEREASIAARVLESLEGATSIEVREGSLVVDGVRARIPFDAPLPLLLPFRPRS